MVECCSELAQMERDGYQPKDWGAGLGDINQWGGNPPLKFLLTGFPIAKPRAGPADVGDGARPAPPRG